MPIRLVLIILLWVKADKTKPVENAKELCVARGWCADAITIALAWWSPFLGQLNLITLSFIIST
jgi:hypothetical protein